jgi:hypothetical protein
MDDNDECEWQMSEDQTHQLHLLVVSFSFKLCFVTNPIYQSSYNGPATGSHYVPSTISKSSVHFSTPVPSGSGDGLSLSDRQIEFMTTLDMDKGLVGKKGSTSSLEMIWKRYVAITKAFSDAGDVDWASGVKKPSQTEIISVYGGKSSFYEQSKVLQHVTNYPDMKDWLERTESDMEKTTKFWGFYKATYAVKDLEKWIEHKNAEVEKEKGKGKGKGNGKKKGSELTTPVKKSHKKSAGLHKQ